MSRFKYYLEAINEKTQTQKQKSQERLKRLEELDTEVGKKADELEETIINWNQSGHQFMEKIKEEWTKDWDMSSKARSTEFQKSTREFARQGNTYYVTLQTPSSAESDKERYSHTAVDKCPNGNQEENIKDARRRALLQSGLHTALYRLKQSKTLPVWIKSFEKYNNTLEIKIQ